MQLIAKTKESQIAFGATVCPGKISRGFFFFKNTVREHSIVFQQEVLSASESSSLVIVMQIYFLHSFYDLFAKLLHTNFLLCIARQLWRECWEGKVGRASSPWVPGG